YEWPLNIRELEQALAAAAILAQGTIELDHLPAAVRRVPTVAVEPATASASAEELLKAADEQRRAQMIALFQVHEGNVPAVARAMGKAPMQVRRWAKRYAINPDDYRRP